MKQQTASSSRLATAIANVLSNSISLIRKFCLLLAISIVLMLSTAANDASDARFHNLGHRMMCTCNCKQVLLECNHGGRFSLTGSMCVTYDHMRGELRAALLKGDTDDVILHSFIQKHGAAVLVEPPVINKLVWIVAFAALAAFASFVIAFVRKRKSRQGTLTTPLAQLQGVDARVLGRVRGETENDDSL